jgi:hypothetical protein
MNRVNIEKLVGESLEKTKTDNLIIDIRDCLAEHVNKLTTKLQERSSLIEQVKILEDKLSCLNKTISEKDKEFEHYLNLVIQDNSNLYKLTRKRTKENQDLIDCVSVSQKHNAVLQVLNMLTNHFQQLKLNDACNSDEHQQASIIPQHQIQLHQSQNHNIREQQKVFPCITLTQYCTNEEYDHIVLEYAFYVKLLENHFGPDPTTINNNIIIQLTVFQQLQSTQILINKTKQTILTERRDFLLAASSEGNVEQSALTNCETIVSEIDIKISELKAERFTLDSGRNAGLVVYFNRQHAQISEVYTFLLSEYFGTILPDRTKNIQLIINMINNDINEKWMSSPSLLSNEDLLIIENFSKLMLEVVLKYRQIFINNEVGVNNLFTIPPFPLLIENTKKTLIETYNSTSLERLPQNCKFCEEPISHLKPLCHVYCGCVTVDTCVQCKVKEWLTYRCKYKEQQDVYSNISICCGCKNFWNIYNISAII